MAVINNSDIREGAGTPYNASVHGWVNQPQGFFQQPLDIYNKINVNQIRDLSYDVATTGRWYIFMVKPSCNLTSKTINCSRYFYYLANYKLQSTTSGGDIGHYIFNSLTYGMSSDLKDDSNQYSPIITLLTNVAKGFTPNDTNTDVMTVNETPNGWKHSFAKHNINSLSANTFSIDYVDLIGYPVLNLHKAWDEYIQKVRSGIISANPDFLRKRMFDYPSALYYFHVSPDGYTLDYWCKYIGVYPIKVPYSAMKGDPNTETPTISIDYQYVIKSEDMDPIVLDEFNKLFGHNENKNPQRQDYSERFFNWFSGYTQKRENTTSNANYLRQQVERRAQFKNMTTEEYLAKNPDVAKTLRNASGNRSAYLQPDPGTANDVKTIFRSVDIDDVQEYDSDNASFESINPEVVLLSFGLTSPSRLALIFN